LIGGCRSVALRGRAADGTPVHSFRTLLDDLSSIVRNRYRTRGHPHRHAHA
jgi:hypothetical protein